MKNLVRLGTTILLIQFTTFFNNCSPTDNGGDNGSILGEYVCILTPDSMLILPKTLQTINVTDEIDSLQNSYKISLTNDTLGTMLDPLRIVILLDKSSSMCGTNGNDATDRRISAAHAFVDSIANESPISEISIFRYSREQVFKEGVSYNLPISVQTEENIALIHSLIDSSACAKPGGISKELATKETRTGTALRKALTIVDTNYDLIKDSLTRHIIILTDGEWDDSLSNSSSILVDSYLNKNPGRVLPRIHGVFLSTDYVNENTHSDLKKITELSGGMYFPGETAETIVDRFTHILHRFRVVHVQQLEEFSITHLQTKESIAAAITANSFYENSYSAIAKKTALHKGLNTIEFLLKISIRSEETNFKTDTVISNTLDIITNSSEPSDTTIGEFTIGCTQF